MYRRTYELLVRWKENEAKRKPLLLLGARQTGKTYLVRKFASEYYESFVEVNFERDKNVSKFFEDNLNPKNIITKLENYYGKRILPNNTLIFFDEVQACESAITSLKYFNEEANEYNIICAGSL